MFQYSLVFLLHPPGLFGLPDGNKIVTPARIGPTDFPAFDRLTGNMVGHGTLPHYRDTPLRLGMTVQDARLRVEDNYLHMVIEAPNSDAAVERGLEIANTLCLFTSAYNGHYIHADIVQAVDETHQTRVPVPKVVRFTETRYNLEELKSQIQMASNALVFKEDRLNKAVSYLYHALLQSQELDRVNPLTFHGRLLVSEIVLNCYKAASTILGDPSVKGDKDYQSRWKKFGMDHSLFLRVEELRNLRNSSDVAHYSPDWSSAEALERRVQFARQVGRDVILAYISWASRDPSKNPSEPK